jgi:hypothetical protein
MSSDNDNKGNEIVISKDGMRKFQGGGHAHGISPHHHFIMTDNNIQAEGGVGQVSGAGWMYPTSLEIPAMGLGDQNLPYNSSTSAFWFWPHPDHPDDPQGGHDHPRGTHRMQTTRAGGGSAATPSGNSGGRLKGVGGYRSGGSLQRQSGPVKKTKQSVSQPVRRNMANGGVAKAKPASRSTCCRGGGGRATPRPAPRSAPRSAPLSGGSRSGGVR